MHQIEQEDTDSNLKTPSNRIVIIGRYHMKYYQLLIDPGDSNCKHHLIIRLIALAEIRLRIIKVQRTTILTTINRTELSLRVTLLIIFMRMKMKRKRNTHIVWREWISVVVQVKTIFI